ncbi:hypothetical protein [Mesorhizobium sp. 43Arga]
MRLHTEFPTDWKNIVQLWRENGEVLPFKAVKSSWSADVGHYLVVERVEVKTWPYGNAWGQCHWQGVPGGHGEKVNQPGTYTWRKL